jgi:hypothetical protein
MASTESEAQGSAREVLLNRRFVTCRECGWVHYVMTSEEKTTNDRFIARYRLTEQEQEIYESAFRQCLRCETPASDFRAANEKDLDRAEGHLVTPVLVGPEVGTQ